MSESKGSDERVFYNIGEQGIWMEIREKGVVFKAKRPFRKKLVGEILDKKILLFTIMND